MTEFQMATLELSRIGLWISAIHALISLVVGSVQCFLILYGLRQMNRASAARDKQHEETMAALDTRHRESMGALETRHRESMRALETRHRESMRALEALIERTSK